jgi:hypothetical protein
MKQRPPKRPKQFRRQQPKRYPLTSTHKLPPLDWLTPLAQPTPIRGTPNPAFGTSGIVQPPLPLREAAAQVAFEGEGGLRADVTVVAGTGSYELQGGATKSVIERRLSEQPAAIRDIALALSKEFRSQTSELKQQRPNDPDRIAQLDNLVVLSGNMASGFAHLAENLDQAISKGSKDKPEPVFLGKAAEVVQRLHFGLMEWLKENGTVFEVPYRISIFVVGVAVLHSLGADSTAAIGALGLLVRSTASKKKVGKNKKKAGKK